MVNIKFHNKFPYYLSRSVVFLTQNICKNLMLYFGLDTYNYQTSFLKPYMKILRTFLFLINNSMLLLFFYLQLASVLSNPFSLISMALPTSPAQTLNLACDSNYTSQAAIKNLLNQTKITGKYSLLPANLYGANYLINDTCPNVN